MQEDDFDSAFLEAIGKTEEAQEPEAEPEETQEETQEPEETPQPAEIDIWDGATEAQRQAFEELQARVEKSEHSAKSNSGRVGALQKQINELNAAIAAQRAAPVESKEEVSEFETDFPDHAQFFKEKAESKVRESEAKLTEEFNKQFAEFQANMYRNTLDIMSPGWQEKAQTQEFGDWLDRQSPEDQELARSLNPASALKILKKFDEENNAAALKAEQLKQAREKRLQAASTVGSVGSTQKPEEQDDFDSAWNAALKSRRNNYG